MTSRRIAVWVGVMIVVSAGLARGEVTADQLKTQMLDAYQKAQTYQSSIAYRETTNQGRWHIVQSTHLRVAMDRAGHKVLLDRPDFLLASDGVKLRLTSDQVPGYYLEVAAPQPLNIANLTNVVPQFNTPATPDLTLLLAKDPWMKLCGGQVPTAVKALAPDAQHQPGLELTTADGTVELRVDPVSHLVTRVERRSSQTDSAGHPLQTERYDIKIEKLNQPLNDKLFAVATGNATAVSSMQQLVAAAKGGSGSGGAALPTKMPNVSFTQPDGTKLTVADFKNDVVVLDLWATWCPPCRAWLPDVQKLYDWAQANKLAVRVYAVNEGETLAQVQAFMKQNKYTLPVLLDQDQSAGNALNVEGIPTTFVIHQGQIVARHEGLEPGELAVLKGEITKALKAESVDAGKANEAAAGSGNEAAAPAAPH